MMTAKQKQLVGYIAAEASAGRLPTQSELAKALGTTQSGICRMLKRCREREPQPTWAKHTWFVFDEQDKRLKLRAEGGK